MRRRNRHKATRLYTLLTARGAHAGEDVRQRALPSQLRGTLLRGCNAKAEAHRDLLDFLLGLLDVGLLANEQPFDCSARTLALLKVDRNHMVFLRQSEAV